LLSIKCFGENYQNLEILFYIYIMKFSPMFSLVVASTILLFVVGFFRNRRATESFISSDKFVGAKKGFVFKNDHKGLGYYIDY